MASTTTNKTDHFFGLKSDFKVQEYKDSLKTKAEELILKGFPETIAKLNDILESPQFLNRECTDIHQDLNIPISQSIVLNNDVELPPAKRTKFDNSISQDDTEVTILSSDAVCSNRNVLELVEIVKPHLRKLVEDFNLLEMGISFMIPKIEGGNDFGVSIQKTMLAHVQYVQSIAETCFNKISRYFIDRGNLISKVTKYPHIDDYRRAVQEVDSKEYLHLWRDITDIRNHYCSIHDIVIKNLDKIKTPRSNNATESLY